MLAVRLKIARLPHMATGLGIYGISLVAGVGFTMSLFIGGLAFGHSPSGYAEQVRLGVIGGSLLAGLLGFLVLRWAYRNNHPLRRSGPA